MKGMGKISAGRRREAPGGCAGTITLKRGDGGSREIAGVFSRKPVRILTEADAAAPPGTGTYNELDYMTYPAQEELT